MFKAQNKVTEKGIGTLGFVIQKIAESQFWSRSQINSYKKSESNYKGEKRSKCDKKHTI